MSDKEIDHAANLYCEAHFDSDKESWMQGYEFAVKNAEARAWSEVIEWLQDNERKSLPYNGIFPNHKMWSDYVKEEAKRRGYLK